MSGKKASKLRFYWIAFMSGMVTLWACVNIIFGPLFARDYRAFVDKVMFNWGRRLLNLVRVKVKVTGLENFPEKGERPIVVMCNHSSLYDIPISAMALNTSLRMLAKKELFKIPIFSAALRRGEFVSIDRHNREQSMKDLQRAKQKMLDGIVLWVAPEGTRSKNGRLAKFKRGGFHVALDTQALIVPIIVKDIHKVQAGDKLDLYLNQQIEVEVCEPIDTAQYSVEQRKDLIDKVRQRMLLGLGQTDD